MHAALIRGKVYASEEDAVKVDVVAACNAGERKERGVNNFTPDRLQCAIESATCNFEQVAQMPHPLWAVSRAGQKRLKEPICVNGFEKTYRALTVPPRGGSVTVRDQFVVRKERNILRIGVHVGLGNKRNCFAVVPALRAAGTLYPRQKDGVLIALVRRRDYKLMFQTEFILYSRS